MSSKPKAASSSLTCSSLNNADLNRPGVKNTELNKSDSNLAVVSVPSGSYRALLPILEAAGLDKVLSITELSGGLSNHNYKITTPEASYVLRENANATDIFCIREQERFYWQQLAKAKVAPQLFWVSDDERYYLSEFIDSDGIQDTPIAEQPRLYWLNLEKPSSAREFFKGANRENTKATIIPHYGQAHILLLELLLKLRDLPAGPYGISVTEQWQEYHQQMMIYATSPTSTDTAIFNHREADGSWHGRVAKLVGIQADIQLWTDKLAACLVSPQFCHRDLNPHNLLLQNNHLYCIDFEYATASHPLCELAVVLATHALTPKQQNFLLDEYLKEHPNLTIDAVSAVPAAIELYWVFACYWAILMAAQQTELSRSAEYIAWFDFFWPMISPVV
ncbi:phosphotransferase [Shewanella profunda]|uniref:phosphotransferase n=1 Tax=Shewanella profunda TaxID=254793 RepID=UPI00200F7B4D|nr:phosphotransferase [Shewanella profunda]MCL1090528.1 phosphotransferase [Shewanella profunda]